MSERGEHFTGPDPAGRPTPPSGEPAPPESYPPSPPPRPEPYSVDEEPSADDGAGPPSPAPSSETPPPLGWTTIAGGPDARYPADPSHPAPTPAPETAATGQPANPYAYSGPNVSRDPYTAGGPYASGDAHAASDRYDASSDRYAPSDPYGYGEPAPATGYPPSQPPVDHPAAPYAAAPAGGYDDGWAAVGSPGESPPYPGAMPPPTRSRRSRERRRVSMGVVVLLVLVSLLGGVVLGALGARELFPASSSSLPPPTSAPAPDRAPDSVAGNAADALESTVYIQVLGESAASSGSGMVLREDGYIVTNNHVIEPAATGGGRVNVTFADGTEEDAEIVGRTSDYDVAVLHVDREGLTPLVLADGTDVVVGDPTVAVGAPLGLEGTVTTGIVSALNRPVQAGGAGGTSSFINAIQTDAAINPGNSGGPLLNLAGEVVGINTAIAQTAGQETGSIGLGFAIPSDQVRRTAEQIIDQGQASYPVIGVALDTRYQGEGVQVLASADAGTDPVTPGGPAAAAGIEAGDVITRFNGTPVTSPPELIVAVRSQAPGETVVLTVRSGGGEQEVEVTLGEEMSD